MLRTHLQDEKGLSGRKPGATWLHAFASPPSSQGLLKQAALDWHPQSCRQTALHLASPLFSISINPYQSWDFILSTPPFNGTIFPSSVTLLLTNHPGTLGPSFLVLPAPIHTLHSHSEKHQAHSHSPYTPIFSILNTPILRFLPYTPFYMCMPLLLLINHPWPSSAHHFLLVRSTLIQLDSLHLPVHPPPSHRLPWRFLAPT